MQLVGIQTCGSCGGVTAMTVPSKELQVGAETCEACGSPAIVDVWHEAPAEVIALVGFNRERNKLNLPPLTGDLWQ